MIYYLQPGSYVTNNGSAFVIKNVICIHEEDAGVLWKHTDYRPNGRSHTVRRRRLVVSMVCTLANYGAFPLSDIACSNSNFCAEYIWNYHFYQDGSIEFEIRLTGILSVYLKKDDEPTPFGTTVAPNINAQYHQHMFSIRVDPMVDGINNSLVESDIFELDAPTGSKDNFAGNAFYTKDTVVATEGGRPYDYAKERRWRIVNPARQHYASGKDVGYSIGVKGGATPMMTKMDGWAAKRAAFLKNTMWVCQDVEDGENGSTRMWPAGKYVPQTKEEPEDSVGSWVEGKLPVENRDILLYVTVGTSNQHLQFSLGGYPDECLLGTTHIPRPEDWPVCVPFSALHRTSQLLTITPNRMPVEHLSVTFKPNSFFKANPSMDVPASSDKHSVNAFGGDSNSEPGSCCQ